MEQLTAEGTATSSIAIAASPDAVYDLVADVSRMGEWSPEATGTIGHPSELKAGDKFWGLNRKGVFRWFTRCTVLAAVPGRRFEFDVDFGPSPISRWTYEFTAAPDGCEVTETWVDRRRGALAAPMKWAGGVMIPGPRGSHNLRNIETTLQRLKAAAEK
ncbi:MAG: SRPBCC family protein [Candidatus Nanopelagicales bacterium]